ncbi:g1072 [Coccomyxa viridis]|uniref:catechol O-methyltransferase n=1 Tax=Coccomyxa viridis TaxID=1274662 RepID=A0ABP1FP01_9CHLO
MLLKHKHRLSPYCIPSEFGRKGALIATRSRLPIRREHLKRQPCKAQRQSQEDPQGGSSDGKRRKAIEDELRDPSNFLEYFVPRPLRLVLTGSGAVSCLIATVITGTQLLSDVKYGGGGASAPTVAINAAGCLLFAALFTADQRAADTRIARRDEVRKAQVSIGDREVYVNKEGERMSRLKEVNSDWIIRRLERWGQRDGMPFIGPQKGALLQQLVRERQPRQVVEVGTMCGYSALLIAQAMGPGRQLISIEADWKWALAAKRFVWQGTQGDKSSKPAQQRCAHVDVWFGNALKQIPEQFRGRPSIDMLFLDGTPSETLQYLKAAEPFLAEGATVVADNAGVFANGGMKPYLEYVRSDSKYSSELVKCKLEWRDDVEDGMEVSQYRGVLGSRQLERPELVQKVGEA